MNNKSIKKLIEDFSIVAKLAGSQITLAELQLHESHAPHQRPSTLPVGFSAVYVFIYADRCLKVGKAGPRSVARYCSQHYGLKAPSTLAKSLIKHQSKLGISCLDESNIGSWIIDNTTRINILMPSIYGPALLSLLESFMQCHLNPEFEGFESQKIPAVKKPATIGDIFYPEPEYQRLRGDPFLWQHMQRDLTATPLPASPDEFIRLVTNSFLCQSGKPLSTPEDFYVEAFAHGGMSSGFVCPEYWRKQAMPLLKKRFISFMKPQP